MVMNVVSIAILLLVAWVWMNRGFFNSFLHMLCVVIAGAIALSVFEFVGKMLIGVAPASTGVLRIVEAAVPAMAIIFPFAVSLLVLRILMDKFVRANATLDKQADTLGGLVCGLISGAVVSGIMVLGINQLPMGKEMFGYQRLEYDGETGSLKRVERLWVPTDDIVATMYGALSTTTFESTPGNALGRLYPDLADHGSAVRQSVLDGDGKTTIRPGDVTVNSLYTVGLDPEGNRIEGLDNAVLLEEGDGRRREYYDVEGELISNDGGLHIVGYVLTLGNGAFEPGASQAMLRPNQVRLVVRPKNGDGANRVMYPIGIVSRGVNAGDETVGYIRSGATNLDVASVPGSDAKVALEFVMPSGYEPAALFVKALRLDPTALTPVRYSSASVRDMAIDDDSLFAGAGISFEDAESAQDVTLPATLSTAGIYMEGKFPSGVGFIAQNVAGIEINEGGRRSSLVKGWFIPDQREQLTQTRAPDPSATRLVITQFDQGRNEQIITVQIKGAVGSAGGGDIAADWGAAPLRDAPTTDDIFLVDRASNDTAYCAGYIYLDNSKAELRFDKGRRFTISDLPVQPQPANRSQRIFLVFVTNSAAKPDGLAVGSEMYLRFSPAMDAVNR